VTTALGARSCAGPPRNATVVCQRCNAVAQRASRNGVHANTVCAARSSFARLRRFENDVQARCREAEWYAREERTPACVKRPRHEREGNPLLLRCVEKWIFTSGSHGSSISVVVAVATRRQQAERKRPPTNVRRLCPGENAHKRCLKCSRWCRHCRTAPCYVCRVRRSKGME